MKKIFLLLLVVSTFLCSCSNNGSNTNSPSILDSLPVAEVLSKNYELEGLYSPPFIFDCAKNEKVALMQGNEKLDSLYRVILPKAYQGQSIYVKLNGTLLSKNDTTIGFIANEVLVAEQKNQTNTCVTYDYWCLGNEPFWNVQVSEKENVIDFFSPLEEKQYHFIYAKPEEKDNSKIYTSESNGNKIKVTITNTKCSDGMSEREYSYSSKVVLNGISYTGCAVSRLPNK